MSGFSTCTAKNVNAYFTNGTLPAPGTVCQPDFQIFQPGNFTSALRRAEPPGSYSFYEAVRGRATSDYLKKSSIMGRMTKRIYI